MRRIHPATVLLAVSASVIGGWAFMELLKPANMLEVIRLFSMC
jgi:hypothetical protein